MVEIIINETKNSNDEVNNQIIELINLLYQDNQQTKNLLIELKDLIKVIHDNQVVNASKNKDALIDALGGLDIVNEDKE